MYYISFSVPNNSQTVNYKMEHILKRNISSVKLKVR